MTGGNPSRQSSFGSLNSIPSHNAALLGATTAFGRPAPKQRAPPSPNGTNGAVAATSAFKKTPSPKHAASRSPGAVASTAGSATGDEGGRKVETHMDGTPTLKSRPVPNLAVPKQPQKGRAKSPANQAAQLATARSPNTVGAGTTSARPRAKTTNRPAPPPKPRRLSEYKSDTAEDVGNKSVDSSPIPPTTSLRDLFERKGSTASPAGKRPEPIVIKPSRDLAIQSPKPIRTSDGGITSMFQMELEEKQPTPRPVTAIDKKEDVALLQYDGPSSDEDYVSASESTAPPSPPITVRKRESRAPSVVSASSARNTSIGNRHVRPLPSPLRHSSTDPIRIQGHERRITSPSGSLAASSASVQSLQSIPAQYHQLYPRRTTPLHTGDALANAIVASSLASSRAPSPHKADPPPVPIRRQKHHTLSFSRTPSPSKHGMRHTLRKEDTDESETEDEPHPYAKHQKKRLVRKHPNKHHEGDRKRWRDAVTERERQRYEGVWASNKGLHCSFTPEEEQALRRAPSSEQAQAAKTAASDQVSNVIARDIWARSRLPDASLEVVWDLVDEDESGRLTKAQFVVGMWLIDQRLKGRKLPVKVSESVWASVRGLQGIKIRKVK